MSLTPEELAERALLGSVLWQPDAILAFNDWLLPADFRTPANGAIYRHLQEMAEEPGGIDPTSLFQRLAQSAEPGEGSITAPYLHTLLVTAPATNNPQPERYATMVLESAIRRSTDRSALRVAQAAEACPELDDIAGALDGACLQLDADQHRWRAATGIGPVTDAAEPLRFAPSTLTGTVPDDRDISIAEQSVIADVLRRHHADGAIADTIRPTDFSDRRLGNAYRAAATLQASHIPADPVAVAWEQQRQHAQHGHGMPPDRLLQLAERGPVGSPEHAAETMMRGRLVRLTGDAAHSVQHAARHHGLHVSDLLYTAHTAYHAVQLTAVRMTGETPGPLPTADPHSAQVIHLRQRSRNLRTALSNSVKGHIHQPTTAEPERQADHDEPGVGIRPQP